MNNSEYITQLYGRYVSAMATEEELAELFSLADDPANESVFMDLFSGSWDELHKISQNLNRSKAAPAVVHRVHFLKTSWFRYAAAVVLLVGGAAVGYKILKQDKGEILNQVQHDGQGGDIAPGSEKAVLTLADGSTIILDNAANGNVAQQGGTKIIKLDNGQLAYSPLQGESRHPELVSGSLLYNTISTPRGGQYQITLPDGTKVWLNAASSIKFPTAFTGSTREVEMIGEAYMEIAKNSKQPFRVKANGTEIQVLGTSFNINAYSDEEAVKTTLVEGRVRVSSLKSNVILKPGQQARIALAVSSDQQAKGITVVNDADIQQALAWKNSLFKFNDASIEVIMRQLARWYNLDVVYQGNVTKTFLATIPRNVPISQVLEALEITGAVKFKVEANKVTVIGQ